MIVYLKNMFALDRNLDKTKYLSFWMFIILSVLLMYLIFCNKNWLSLGGYRWILFGSFMVSFICLQFLVAKILTQNQPL